MSCGAGRTVEALAPRARHARATEATVLETSPTPGSNTSGGHHFLALGEKFMVRADGPDGALHEYSIAYTFGISPLQQYLIAFPGDLSGARHLLGQPPKEQGGQHWFHLYPDRKLPAGDRLHWTGRDQTWNYQCAYCHSTICKRTTISRRHLCDHLDRRRRVLRGLSWPGSRHVAWRIRGGKGACGRQPGQDGSDQSAEAGDNGHWK